MANILKLAPVAIGQFFLPQKLERVPEPDLVMNDGNSVSDFDAIMHTNVSISLCGMIEFIGSIGFDNKGSRIAVDLACGPGHFTLMLAQYLDIDHVIGIDLSEGMLEKASANAEAACLSHRVSFQVGDATVLRTLTNDSFGLVTCTNSAHHLPDLTALKKMLAHMDRVVTQEGTCAVMDLTRMKSEWIVDWYVREMGKEYKDRGLDSLYDDFRNSMLAAWTPEELSSACPTTDSRHWNHFSVQPVPINQFVYSTPKTKSDRDRDFQWKTGNPPIAARYLRDYERYREALFRSFGKC